jgi:hypothetical protein
VWHLLSDDRLKAAVLLAEQVAEGAGTKSALAERYDELWPLGSGAFSQGADGVLQRTANSLAISTLREQPGSAAFYMTGFPVPLAGVTVGVKPGAEVLCDLLRCVFGNPFRKPVFPKTWRTETVTALAEGIYEGRAFDRLPVLADALEEAGCDDPAMLAHLRGDGPHCRGCWVVDLALGKG